MKNKKIILLLIGIAILVLTGCDSSNITKNESNNYENVNDKTNCFINYSSGQYSYYINESLICPQFKDIAYSGTGFFITNSGELYEYSNKKYSTTGNNCKKIESNVLFTNIIQNTLVSNDEKFYSLNNGNLKEITNEEIIKGRTFYGLDQMEIKLYKINNKIFYLDKLDINDPEIYGYINGNNIYSISYDRNLNKTDEKLLITFEDDEKIKKTTNGFITTNKGYYRYGITNQKECFEYADIKCTYGLVLVDTIDNCREIFYISNDLIISNNMIK